MSKKALFVIASMSISCSAIAMWTGDASALTMVEYRKPKKSKNTSTSCSQKKSERRISAGTYLNRSLLRETEESQRGINSLR